MKHWRITKYDPAFRDKSGHYRREEWTAFDDVGRSFGGTVLTMASYKETEDRYISAAMHFVHDAGIAELVMKDVEKRDGSGDFSEGASVKIEILPGIIRAILRSEMWCKFERPPGFYLHFGYDYYMYVGNQRDLSESVEYAKNVGLFVEDCVSPYLQWELPSPERQDSPHDA